MSNENNMRQRLINGEFALVSDRPTGKQKPEEKSAGITFDELLAKYRRLVDKSLVHAYDMEADKHRDSDEYYSEVVLMKEAEEGKKWIESLDEEATQRRIDESGLSHDELKQHQCDRANSWGVNDAQGCYLCRVCELCEKAKLSTYRPEILTGYDQSDVDEPINPED